MDHLSGTPARYSVGSNHNQWTLIDRHGAILGIFSSKQAHRFAVLGAAGQYACRSEYENISELAPIVVVAVDDERNLPIFLDVSEPFQFRWRGSLRLLIDRRIKILFVEDKANRDNVRLTSLVGRGEMSNAGGANQA